MENLNYFELINKRESCRDFAETEVESEKLQSLGDSFALCDALDEDINTELHVIDRERGTKLGGTVGYNGFMIAAPQYALLFTEEKEHCLENAAFIMQALTLKMTSMGLAACWLTVNDAEAAKKLAGADTEKTLAVVVAFGYRNKEKKSTRLDIASPSDVKVKKSGRTAPKIALDDFVCEGTFGSPADLDTLAPQYPELHDALVAMSNSQSFFNRQPYRVVLTKDEICLIGLEDAETGEADRLLNYGIAMFNFAAVNEHGGAWTFEPAAGDLRLPENAQFIAQCRL
ncbi:Putative TM nitroreductase [Eubacterium pyruvativorans]|uniref:Putative TM nitroreductase n=1 Tax=Eubacterium pyruvativorans TaxID=155865 RepID=A0A1I7EUW2_9FIRM|nr:nitroreductase family protein [Eubacterium pyruvativorans]SFN89256.1 Putative TM nitroreductase [Eubacterium pyruvativorans]SFU27692.1 Putative TM nitroreductase [Eubacterium pyruvativorans]